LVLVVVKLAAVLIFLGESAGHVRSENWMPFMPFGFSGVLTAASVTFIAFGGFEAMTTAAEEAKNPQRDLPRALGITLLVVMLAYVAVAAVMTGVMPYQELDVADPMTVVLAAARHPWAAQLIAAAALFGMTSVLLALFVAQPRIIFAMARDGLLPDALAKLHHRFGTPQRATLAVGLLVAVIASLLPIQVVAELCSLGILTASLIVCLAVLVLRYSHPDLPRPFRMPAAFLLAPLGILVYLTLIFMLPAATLLRYLIWLGLGTLLWLVYGRRTSHLA
jgi:APA family basic amino acid/polyamine antiporter